MTDDQYSLKEYLRNLRSFSTRVNPEFYKKLKVILDRDGTHIQDFLGRAIMDHVKVHGDGNQNYKLDLFNDPNMVATPAFFRDREVWEKFMYSLDLKRYHEFDSQLNMITNLANRRFADLGR